MILGLHRDTGEPRTLRLPLLGCGVLPVGPQRLHARAPDALTAVAFGEHIVTDRDLVLADDDGVLFVPSTSRTPAKVLAQRIIDAQQREITEMRNMLSKL